MKDLAKAIRCRSINQAHSAAVYKVWKQLASTIRPQVKPEFVESYPFLTWTSAMPYSRTLQFKSNDLGRDIRLLLSLSPLSLSIGTPVVWKVATFAAEGRTSITATYENNLAFFVPQDETLISTDPYTHIEKGQKTVISVKPETNPPVYEFSAPTTVGGTEISVHNSTGGKVDIGYGFLTDLGGPNETLNKVEIFRGFGNDNTFNVGFQPILSLYVDPEYQNGAVVDKLPPPIWSQELRPLTSSSTWIISLADDGRVVVTNDAD